MKPPQKQIITSWNLHESAKMSVVTPNNFDELVDCINFAKKNNLKITIKGGGNSFSDVGLYDEQLLIDFKNLNSIRTFDTKNGIVQVEAGYKYNLDKDIIFKIDNTSFDLYSTPTMSYISEDLL